MSGDEDSIYSSSSSSSSIDWNQRLNDFNQWQNRIVEQNHELDRMMDDAIISHHQQLIQQPHSNPRAQRHYYERNREEGHQRLYNEYFANNPVYNDHTFRRRFRMCKHVFLRIVDTLTNTNQYFQQRPDATGRQGLYSLQKCTGVIRVLAYGTVADSVDEYLRMRGAVTRQSITKFVEGIISNFSSEYLRRPNEQDLARLLYVGERRGFPGMLSSIDCMHWEWRNCPTAWAGQYAGRSGRATKILEVVASYDLWIWHAFFGTPGSCNDINVLQRSPFFNDILQGLAPNVNFVVENHQYNMGYYLTDGIYPQWAAFVKTISGAILEKHKKFARHQESARKDVERAFGVLQARFAFIHRPCLVWDDRLMGKILMACIIMHNMIVEDERDTYQNYCDISEYTEEGEENCEISGARRSSSVSSYMENRSQLRN